MTISPSTASTSAWETSPACPMPRPARSARKTSRARKGKAGMSTDGPAMNAARDLGQGWKVSPYRRHQAQGDVRPGRRPGHGRHPADLDDAVGHVALRHPSVLLGRREGALGRGPDRRLLRLRLADAMPRFRSLPVCVNPGSAFNCYWQMPFRKSFKITSRISPTRTSRSTIRSTTR